MSRLSLRLRLSLAFAAVMALVLSLIGVFVYVRLDSSLTQSLDRQLRAQLAEVEQRAARPSDPGERSGDLVDRDSSAIAQLISAAGEVLRGVPQGGPPLLGAAQRRRALAGTVLHRSGALPGHRGDWRLLAAPVSAGGQRAVAVVAASLRSNEEALDQLLAELLVAGPVALLLAALAGYGVAAGALRPVEAMRRRAAQISAARPGARLPVPPSNDEIARLGETLNEMLARIEAAVEHERRFVADASHELRSPLALLKTEIELALRRPRSQRQLETALLSAGEETDRLARLAEDLLLIARGDRGALSLRAARLPVSELFEDVAGRYERQSRRAGRAIEVAADSCSVDADRLRLEQALGNLVENALRHGAGTICLEARELADSVELHVRDQGSGFPPEFLGRAFERFSRADDARGRGGTGLGLAIVDLIARAHGGSAGAANTGVGTDVWISLPAEPET